MVWVYERTGSLLVAMLMHASLTASTMIVEPPGIEGESLVAYDFGSAIFMWLVVAIAVTVDRAAFAQKKMPESSL